MRLAQKWDQDNFFCPSITDFKVIPVKINVYFQNRQVRMNQRSLMGLINHSQLIRGRLQSAIQLRQKFLKLEFTGEVIDDPHWLNILAGIASLEPHIRHIDLQKFIAFAHLYMFKETFVNHIISYDICNKTPSVAPAIYYCWTVINWGIIAHNLWTFTLGFNALSIPDKSFQSFPRFSRFVRSALRSSYRYLDASKFNDPYTGMPRHCAPERKCPMCVYRGHETPIGINFYQRHRCSSRSRLSCPSVVCTASYGPTNTLYDMITYYHGDRESAT